jgi:hypothetical protein
MEDAKAILAPALLGFIITSLVMYMLGLAG